MLKHGRSGVVLALVLALSARVGLAQDASKDEEIQDLKRRLEALEKKQQEQQAKEAALPGAAVVADPVEEKWYDKVHVGGGVRTEYRAAEVDLGPTGNKTKYTSDFTLDSARLYTGGKINDWLSATLNAEFTANHAVALPGAGLTTTGSPQVLDAIAQVKVMNELNIFMGRMLPATDRSNSDGPYYLNTWDFPFLSDGFNAAGTTGDRDTGVTVWGDVGNFKYWAGIYEGNDHGAPTATVGDRLLYAARVQYNFFDAEPGYYLQSTYYGDKRVLAIGLVANYQGGAVLTPGGGVTAYGNVAADFLWEEKMAMLGDGVPFVEAAYYYFGRHGIGTESTATLAGPFDVGAGTGFLFSVGYLIPGKVGWGQFQPTFRYQGFNSATTNAVLNPPPPGRNSTNRAEYDLGVNYVMVGHNARITFAYSHIDVSGPKEFGQYVIGTQFQF
jgi:hypothetical protein